MLQAGLHAAAVIQSPAPTSVCPPPHHAAAPLPMAGTLARFVERRPHIFHQQRFPGSPTVMVLLAPGAEAWVEYKRTLLQASLLGSIPGMLLPALMPSTRAQGSCRCAPACVNVPEEPAAGRPPLVARSSWLITGGWR